MYGRPPWFEYVMNVTMEPFKVNVSFVVVLESPMLIIVKNAQSLRKTETAVRKSLT
ncbi:hypothetical protein HMI56_000208 [Coelomomyces lativittatus]|nr:hypothetical protein HMI56_000208 [Coelomomyces lativittatus]